MIVKFSYITHIALDIVIDIAIVPKQKEHYITCKAVLMQFLLHKPDVVFLDNVKFLLFKIIVNVSFRMSWI